MERGRRGTVRAFVTTAVVMASVLGAMVQGVGASAAPAQADQPKINASSFKVTKQGPAKKRALTTNGNSGGRTGDIDRLGREDILAVPHGNPAPLKVYPNVGYNAGNPLATYGPSVTISNGWSGMKWVGHGNVSGDEHPDVLGIDGANNLYAFIHGGKLDGDKTLVSRQFVSTGWGSHDLIHLTDLNGDGLDDVLARATGSNDFYAYLTVLVNGTIGQQPGVLYAQWNVPSPIVDLNYDTDVTGDNVEDWILRLENGFVLVYDDTVGQNGESYLLSSGWQTISAFVISDVNDDKKPDILARWSNGDLNAYLHTGVWNPTPDFTVFDTLASPKVVSQGWNGIRVIS